MSKKPTCEELEQRVKELEKAANDRVSSEKQLKLLSLAVNQSSEGVAVVDMNGNLEYLNNAFAEMHGYSAEELVGKNLSIFHTPEQMPHVEATNLEIKQKGSFKGEIWHVKRDGTVFPTIMHNSLIRDETNKPIGIMGTLRDITDIKQSEEALRKSEEKFRTLVEHSPLGVSLIGKDGRYKYTNLQFRDIFGYTPEDIPTGADWFKRAFPDKRDRAIAVNTWIEDLKQTGVGQSRPSVYTVTCKNGSRKQIQFRPVTLKNLDQFVIYEDITDRKQAEDKLLETRDYLDNLFNHANAPIIVWDTERRITRFNHAFEHMTGLSADEVIGQELSILFPESSRDESLQKIVGTLSGEYWESVEIPILRKDGDVRTALWNSASIYAEDRVTVIATIAQGQDISERKLAEGALRESEEKYRTVLEANPDPVVVYDIEGKVIYFNPAFTRVFGWPLEERLRKKMDVFVPEESWQKTKMMIEKVLAGERFSGIETCRYNKKGEIVPVSISGAVYKDQNGNPIGSIINLRDISDQKKMETQLRQSQKMESIGTLAGGIAHEFNNILGIIISNTELASKDVPEWSPAKECLKEIRTASLRAADVVRRILGFARKSVFPIQPLHLSPVIREATTLIRASIPSTIEIRQNLSCKSDTVMADPTQINQVLMNMCVNAKNAMQEQGGVLEIKLEDTSLDEKSATRYEDLMPGNYVKLTVRDTGHGIDPEIIDRIFDPYFTTKSLAEGTGMGLAVVHGIVKHHKGAITVASEPGKGTVFEVLFPLTEAEAEQEAGEAEALPTGAERILFVDDEESLVKLGQKMLNQLGYSVETKRNPIEALALVRSEPNRFDLIITDMTMPKMTGDRLAKEILSIRPDMPIILCTGFSEKIDDKKAQALGIRRYIEKPFVLSDFAIAIRNVLDA